MISCVKMFCNVYLTWPDVYIISLVNLGVDPYPTPLEN